jgi:hypothetical protein
MKFGLYEVGISYFVRYNIMTNLVMLFTSSRAEIRQCFNFTNLNRDLVLVSFGNTLNRFLNAIITLSIVRTV